MKLKISERVYIVISKSFGLKQFNNLEYFIEINVKNLPIRKVFISGEYRTRTDHLNTASVAL